MSTVPKIECTGDCAPITERCDGEIFRSLGAEPIINCTGVRTLYGGCNPTAAVLAAMEAASHAFVDMNELAEAIGRKLATLTGAEWGVVTAGSVAAISQAVAACIAGNDPEKMLKLPIRGEKIVLVAADQRMPYEHAIRAVGCRVVPVSRALDVDRLPIQDIAAICLVGHDIATSALSFDEIAAQARRYRIPLIVDGAGLAPIFPNIWLRNGADLLIHSGGKYISGPQSTGFLLGSESLCRAAYFNGPPNQSFGRSMKVGKDEIVGAYTALEQWITGGEAVRAMKRWRECVAILEDEFLNAHGLRVEKIEPDGAFCNPRIAVSWNFAEYPLDSGGVAKKLFNRRPRVVLHDYWQRPHRIVIDPTNLTESEAKIVACSIVAALKEAPTPEGRRTRTGFDEIAGSWDVSINFLHGTATHRLVLSQDRQDLSGSHVGTDTSGICRGIISGSKLTLVSRLPGDPMGLDYQFDGSVDGDTISGIVHLGASTSKHNGITFKRQFGQASWLARRVSTVDQEKGGQHAHG